MRDYFNEQKQYIDKQIALHLPSQSELKHVKAAAYSMLPGGKRYRTIIAQEIYSVFGGTPEQFNKALVGIEFLHCASLILDDLPSMDDATMRQGQLCAHKQFGESNAILASVFLLENGRQLLNQTIREHLDEKDDILKADLLVNTSLIGLLEGQELDLVNDKSKEDLEKSILLKNRLFYLAVTLPIVLTNRKAELQRFEKVADMLSVAYQLFDDLRDIMSSSVTGKDSAVDSEKNTSVYRYGPESVESELKELLVSVKSELGTGKECEKLVAMIEHIFRVPS